MKRSDDEDSRLLAEAADSQIVLCAGMVWCQLWERSATPHFPPSKTWKCCSLHGRYADFQEFVARVEEQMYEVRRRGLKLTVYSRFPFSLQDPHKPGLILVDSWSYRRVSESGCGGWVNDRTDFCRELSVVNLVHLCHWETL